MPTRMVREGIIDSRAVNSLTDSGEILYRRLMSIVDDFGRYEADPELLRGDLFKRQLDRWSLDRVECALAEVAATINADGEPLVEIYRVGNKDYLQITNLGQRIRTESKYPAPGAIGKEAFRRGGLIYFIQAEVSRKIKIGYTETKPEQRLSALQTSCAERLRLICSFSGTMADERNIHKQFSALRLTGEWFNESEELLAYIGGIQNASAVNCEHLSASASIGVPTRERGRTEAEPEPEAYSEPEAEPGNENFPPPQRVPKSKHPVNPRIDVSDWVERLYRLSLKRKDRTIAEHLICERVVSGEIDGPHGVPFEDFERRWGEQNTHEDWLWKGGAKAQTLARWTEDGNYRYDVIKPIVNGQAGQEAKGSGWASMVKGNGA